jgi:Trk-type K+ transport system membrane component
MPYNKRYIDRTLQFVPFTYDQVSEIQIRPQRKNFSRFSFLVFLLLTLLVLLFLLFILLILIRVSHIIQFVESYIFNFQNNIPYNLPYIFWGFLHVQEWTTLEFVPK